MATPISRKAQLDQYANRIYEIMMQAEADGFKMAIVRGVMVDLYDPETDTSTPLPGVLQLLGG